jgi:hypothetical protein
MMLFLEPPPQYDHPYNGRVIEQRVSFLQMIQLCHGLTRGCSWVKDGVCYIALPQDEKDDRLIAFMRQHEIGHCNGWPSTMRAAAASNMTRTKAPRRKNRARRKNKNPAIST